MIYKIFLNGVYLAEYNIVCIEIQIEFYETVNRKYKGFLFEHLQDYDEAVAYLSAALEEIQKGDKESQQLFLIALRNIADVGG